MAEAELERRAVEDGEGRWVITSILMLALGLRVWGLGVKDFWHDEVHNLLKTESLWGVLTQGELVSNHPPLFTLLLTVWRAVFPDTEFALRYLPALLGVAGVYAIYRAGSVLVDRRTGLIAAILLATSPFHVLHSQDLKVYILLPVTGTLAILFLFRAAQSGSWRDWTGYALWAAAACYSDLFAAPLLIAANLWFVIDRRSGPVWRWIAANLAGAVLFLPQLGIMLRKAQAILLDSQAWWVPSPGLREVGYYIKTIAVGYSPLEPVFFAGIGVFGGLLVAGLWRGLKDARSGAGLLALCFVLPIGICFAASHITQSFFLTRAMLPFAIPAYLLVAAFIAKMNTGGERFVAIVVVVASAGWSLYGYYLGQFPRDEFPGRPGIHLPVAFEDVAQTIAEEWQDGDVILHTSASSWLPAYWYGLRDKPMVFAAARQSFVDHINRSNPPNTDDPALAGYFPREIQGATEGYRRAWLVFSEWERAYLQGTRRDPGNASQVWLWLDGHGQQSFYQRFAGVELMRYELDPAVTVRRSIDTGVASALGFADGREHVRVVPDNGNFPEPGTLPAPRDGLARLSWNPEKPAQYVVEDNKRSMPKGGNLFALRSEALLPAASFFEDDPLDERWEVIDNFMTDKPRLEGSQPQLLARLRPGESITVSRGVALSGATYRLYVMPGLRTAIEEAFEFSINDEVLGKGATLESGWWASERFDLPEGSHTVQIRALGGEERRESLVRYLAFVRSDTEFPRDVAKEYVTLEPGQRLVRRLPPCAECPRADVWFVSEEAERYTYWIYQETR